MKKQNNYEAPEIVIEELDNADIITDSFGNGDSTILPFSGW